VIQRLNNDIHVALESLEDYDSVRKAGLTLHSAKELCVVGWDPFVSYFRFALSKKFPGGPINSSNLLDTPFLSRIEQILKLPDGAPNGAA